MSVTLTDEQAKNMAASLRNAANVLDPPVTTPTPPPPTHLGTTLWLRLLFRRVPLRDLPLYRRLIPAIFLLATASVSGWHGWAASWARVSGYLPAR
jgi:hypothetical protein